MKQYCGRPAIALVSEKPWKYSVFFCLSLFHQIFEMENFQKLLCIFCKRWTFTVLTFSIFKPASSSFFNLYNFSPCFNYIVLAKWNECPFNTLYMNLSHSKLTGDAWNCLIKFPHLWCSYLLAFSSSLLFSGTFIFPNLSLNKFLHPAPFLRGTLHRGHKRDPRRYYAWSKTQHFHNCLFSEAYMKTPIICVAHRGRRKNEKSPWTLSSPSSPL